jgi:hypothetical protein
MHLRAGGFPFFIKGCALSLLRNRTTFGITSNTSTHDEELQVCAGRGVRRSRYAASSNRNKLFIHADE